MSLLIQRQPGSIHMLLTDEESMRVKSHKVKYVDSAVQDVIRQMQETCLDWEQGRKGETAIAMAAMQIGYKLKIVVVRSNPKDRTPDFDVYINPKIIRPEAGPIEMHEGCLSVPNIYARVMRPGAIKVKAWNLQGQLIRFKCDGLLARVLQHECDHFNGQLFTDHVTREDWIHINDLAKKTNLADNKHEHDRNPS